MTDHPENVTDALMLALKACQRFVPAGDPVYVQANAALTLLAIETRVAEEAAAKPNTNHVVMAGDTFLCDHCGASYRMNYPAPINVSIAAMNAYVADHCDCPKKELPT